MARWLKRTLFIAPAPLIALLLAATCTVFQPNPRTITVAEWGQVLDSHRGGIVVTYVWADWCRPCVEALPGYAELQRSYETADVQFVTLFLDDSRDNETVGRAHRRSQESDAGGEHYLLSADFAEALEAINVPRIPAIVVHGSAGERRATLLGDESDNRIFPEDIKGALDGLLDAE